VHERVERGLADEPGPAQLVEVLPEGGVETVRVEDDDRLVVHAERAGRPHLEQLLQRADPAG